MAKCGTFALISICLKAVPIRTGTGVTELIHETHVSAVIHLTRVVS